MCCERDVSGRRCRRSFRIGSDANDYQLARAGIIPDGPGMRANRRESLVDGMQRILES
jgi:hypothetical protein